MQILRGVVESRMSDVELDNTDEKLLSALSHNARLPYSRLARIVNLSKDGVRYRLKKLTEHSVILGNAVIINPFMFFNKFSVLAFDTRALSFEREREIIIRFAQHPNTLWVGKNIGAYNLTVFYCHNNERTTSELKRMANLPSYQANITAMHCYLNIPPWFLAKTGTERLVLPRMDSSFHKICKKPSVEKCSKPVNDETDLRIMSCLNSDCTISLAAIAREIRKPFNTVKNRIKSMIHRNAVLSFNTLINLSLLGMITFAVFIQTEKNTSKLLSFLKNHHATGFLFESKGKWSFIWYGAVKTNAELHYIIEGLHSEFQCISELTTMIVTKDYKFTFTPAVLFN